MDIEEIRKKHESLVSGGYATMLPSAKINYHTRTTIMACIDELESAVEHDVYGKSAYMENRINELKQLLE